MKKVLPLMLAFCLMIFSVPIEFVVHAESTFDFGKVKGNNITWTLNKDGTLVLSGTGAMENITFLNDIPWININDEIKHVIINDGITSIGKYSFDGCVNLLDISIPDSVVSIGSMAFAGCRSLTTITMPRYLENIYSYAFRDCTNLTGRIVIPNTTKYIGEAAFWGCKNISDIYILNKDITMDGLFEFMDCDNLTIHSANDSVKENHSVKTCNIPVKSIAASGEYWFDNPMWILEEDGTFTLFGIKEFEYTNNIHPQNQGKYCWEPYKDKIKSIIVEENVNGIGDYSFGDCDNLTYVYLSDGVKSIGNYAFSDCPELESIVIPYSVTSIGKLEFDIFSEDGKTLTIYGAPNSYAQVYVENLDHIYGRIVHFQPYGSTETNTNGIYIHDTFEGTTNEWSSRGGPTIKTSDRSSYSGSESLLITNRVSSWNGATKALSSEIFKSGETFSFSAFVAYSDGSKTDKFYMKLSYIDEKGEHYSTIAETTAVKGKWVQLANRNYQIPENASDVFLFIETDETTSDFYLDEVVVAEEGKEIVGAIQSETTTQPQPEPESGDCNSDGVFNISDVVTLQKWLLAVPDVKLTNWKAADLNENGTINVFDLCMMKRLLISQN